MKLQVIVTIYLGQFHKEKKKINLSPRTRVRNCEERDRNSAAAWESVFQFDLIKKSRGTHVYGLQTAGGSR